MISDPQEVAKAVLLEAIRCLEDSASCHFCECGEYDWRDGTDLPHSEDCPLHGYDMTPDVERLKAWATQLHGAEHKEGGSP